MLAQCLFHSCAHSCHSSAAAVFFSLSSSTACLHLPCLIFTVPCMSPLLSAFCAPCRGPSSPSLISLLMLLRLLQKLSCRSQSESLQSIPPFASCLSCPTPWNFRPLFFVQSLRPAHDVSPCPLQNILCPASDGSRHKTLVSTSTVFFVFRISTRQEPRCSACTCCPGCHSLSTEKTTQQPPENCPITCPDLRSVLASSK